MDRRCDLVFVWFIYPIVGFLAVAIALNWTLLPIFFPLVAGLTLLGTAVASGFYELARRRERGMDASWRHFFLEFTSPNMPSIAVLTAVPVGIYVRSEEHTSELQSLKRISYAVLCLKKKKNIIHLHYNHQHQP